MKLNPGHAPDRTCRACRREYAEYVIDTYNGECITPVVHRRHTMPARATTIRYVDGNPANRLASNMEPVCERHAEK